MLNALELPRFHVRGPTEKLFEEAYDWARPMTDAECLRRHLVGVDMNMAFAAGANGLPVGLRAPTHVKAPAVDPKLPGPWLVDLSHVDLSRGKVGKEWGELDGSLLPSPFTPKGESERAGLVRDAHPWRAGWSSATRCVRPRHGSGTRTAATWMAGTTAP